MSSTIDMPLLQMFFLFMPSGHIAMAWDLSNAAKINNRWLKSWAEGHIAVKQRSTFNVAIYL